MRLFKAVFLVCVIGCCWDILFAQSYGYVKRSDSLINDAVANKKAIDLVNEANTHAISNPVKSMQLATAALEKSITTGDKNAQYQSYNTLGTLYYNIANYSRALQYFQLASKGFLSTGNATGKNYADKYQLAASQKLEESGKYSKRKKTKEKESVVKENKSSYRTTGIDDKNAFKALNDADKIDIYRELGAIAPEHRDTLLANHSIPPIMNTWDNKTVLSNARALNYNYNAAGMYKDNIDYQKTVLQEGLKRSASDIVGTATLNIGNTFNEAKEPDKAIPFLMKSMEMAERTGNVEEKKKAVQELARAYESKGQYEKALKVVKKYISSLDSATIGFSRTKEENLALNEEFSRQEKRIQNLIATQKIRDADMRRQKNILWGLAGALILFSGLTWALVRNIRQKQKANMTIKLQSLRAQMNPHFIFNSLNSVNNFISKNDERSANKYLSDFSKLMRTVLTNSSEDFVSLATEMQTLRIYLDLEYFRFGEKFDYTLEVSEDIEPDALQIPPMLIQPYIENAIWHGLRYKNEKGLLSVRFFTENNKLFCTVQDNGIGRKQSAALKTNHQKSYQSTGIKNTKERIEILNKLHGTNLHIVISDLEENGNASGTLVKISLPHVLQFQEA